MKLEAAKPLKNPGGCLKELDRLYEAPVPLIGATVTLLYHDSDPCRVEVIFNGVSHGMLVPLDVHVNARVKRLNQAVDILPADNTVETEGRLLQNGQVFGREGKE